MVKPRSELRALTHLRVSLKHRLAMAVLPGNKIKKKLIQLNMISQERKNGVCEISARLTPKSLQVLVIADAIQKSKSDRRNC